MKTIPAPEALFGTDLDRKDANEERANRAGLEPCATCGRGVREGWFVVVVDGGAALLHPDHWDDPAAEADPGYMGGWILGPECGKHVPGEYRRREQGHTAS